jgi:hypothetical protein
MNLLIGIINEKYMTKDEIIEGNRLIAEFMGGKFTLIKSHTPNVSFKKHPRQDRNFNSSNMHPKLLSYHKSFDWLMPVFEKIEKEKGVHIALYPIGCEIYVFGKKVSRVNSDTKIKAIWLSLVGYIKLYNKN